jgi:hypothetical protein
VAVVYHVGLFLRNGGILVFKRIIQIVLGASVALTATALPARAQNGQPMDMPMNMAIDTPGWHFMQDAVVFGVFNHQGSPRGGNEFKAPNWWMGMFSRKLKDSQLTINTMFSLDPATIGEGGYREILQAGEALNGKPLIDHQHPHDFFMQLAGVWRFAVTDKTGFTIAGGPIGEPAIGPVAFMHRASAAENPVAPLSHHTFDSTHIAFGVITAAVDHGPWTAEGSVFNGREPDQHRWDFDFGALDSFSGRLWFNPSPNWEFQVSSARLKHPEELEPGNIIRTTASAGWSKQSGGDFSAVTVGFGVNATAEVNRHALFAEGTIHKGSNSLFSRFELVDVETGLLLNDAVPTGPAARLKNAVAAFTVGGVRDVLHSRGFEGGLGAGLTFYGVPDALKALYGSHPVSFQIFFRLRPPAGPMGRMFNMRMAQPMKAMADMHHQMN